MKSPAAFRASYSDLKLIKTRQCVQIVFELPLSDFDEAYKVLGGLPDPAQERWFGIAPLSRAAAQPQPVPDKPQAGAKRDKMEWRDMQPAAQAALRCNDATFRAFLMEEHEYRPRDRSDPGEAAEFVRSYFGISSRSELTSDHKKRVLWKQMDDQFVAWKALEHA